MYNKQNVYILFTKLGAMIWFINAPDDEAVLKLYENKVKLYISGLRSPSQF